ncbi:phosphatase PAP2 family protein [Rhizobium sp. BK377]|uniref:phosphatase PAP2 family protein n=1 Tax=Rhizobium sp. BK377 TaxID=2587058 RepID=UPI0016231527|nr:phosphatase PAP2 family protein [Rhizobium sp. BK377]MBB3461445.1 membrane-associated phospholipid phosphatase [Rhizobium sp. BK377]
MRKFVSGYWNSASSGVRLPATPSGADRALAVIGTSIVWVSFVFIVFPNLDLVVSRWFASGGIFVLADNPFLREVRDKGRLAQPYLIGSMIVLIALQRLLPERMRICPPEKPLFVLLSFAAGPLLTVQTLKVLIGRVRPRDLVEFGGTMDFTPVWQFSAACSRNCSFPSGEASAAAASLSLLVLVPAEFRRAAAIVLVPCLLFVAFNRVIFGAHFLSDVVLGWLLTMFAMAWVWRWMDAYTEANLWS